MKKKGNMEQNATHWMVLRFASLVIAAFIGFISIYETAMDTTKITTTILVTIFALFLLIGYGVASSAHSKNEIKSLLSWSQPFLQQPIGVFDFMAWFFVVLGISFILSHWAFKPHSLTFGLIPLLIGLGLICGIQLKQFKTT